MLKILTAALLPSLLIQGYFVKKNTLRLPEAKGQRNGVVNSGKTALSILIVGDSAAAGVGVENQQDALLGSILTELQHDFDLRYQLEARTGDTTLQVLERMQMLEIKPFDIVITSVGVNDVTKLISPQKWIQQQQEFYTVIERKFSPTMVLVTGVPPMNLFPALPNPLSWLFGQYSSAMNNKLEKLIEQKRKFENLKMQATII